MLKPKTFTQIKKEATKMEKELRKIYDRLDNLMDDAEISATGTNDATKADKFNALANIIQSARDNTENAYDDLTMVQ